MKTYVCKKINGKIKIDGNLDKPEWSQAQEVKLVDTVTGETPMQETGARLLWNDEFLYVAFECKDTYINATLTEYNSPIYNEEVVEIFLDDDRDLKTYIEIEVSPLNTLLHYAVHNNLQGATLTFARVGKTIESAVRRNDEAGIWSVEMAIPFSEFVTAPNNPPKPGDRWLANLYRIDRSEDGKDEYTAWSPTGKVQYHIPEAFGELVFE